MITRETFKRTMRLLAATFPDRSPTAETSAAYWMALQDLEDEEFENAVMACIRECKFYPRPAEILQRVPRSRPGKLEPAWLNDPAQIARYEQLQEQGHITQRLRRREREEIGNGDTEHHQLHAGD